MNHFLFRFVIILTVHALAQLKYSLFFRKFIVFRIIFCTLLLHYLDPSFSIFIFILLFYLIATIDSYTQLIPNYLLVLMAFLALTNGASFSFISLLLLIFGLSFAHISRAIGDGDIYLLAILCFMVGPLLCLLIFIVACFSACIYFLFLRLKKGQPVPFVPFLLLSYLFIIFFNKEIESLIQFYRGI